MLHSLHPWGRLRLISRMMIKILMMMMMMMMMVMMMTTKYFRKSIGLPSSKGWLQWPRPPSDILVMMERHWGAHFKVCHPGQNPTQSCRMWTRNPWDSHSNTKIVVKVLWCPTPWKNCFKTWGVYWKHHWKAESRTVAFQSGTPMQCIFLPYWKGLYRRVSTSKLPSSTTATRQSMN